MVKISILRTHTWDFDLFKNDESRWVACFLIAHHEFISRQLYVRKSAEKNVSSMNIQSCANWKAYNIQIENFNGSWCNHDTIHMLNSILSASMYSEMQTDKKRYGGVGLVHALKIVFHKSVIQYFFLLFFLVKSP